MKYASIITEKVLREGLPKDVCLNVNFPVGVKLKGYKVVRQANARWQERYVVREDPNNNTYYWLTGELHNNEPEAEDTDEFVVKNGYASVVPCHVDMTHYATVEQLKSWDYEEIE